MIGLHYIPLLIVLIVMSTTSITFYLSVNYFKHVTYMWPYISDTGTYPPESCIFGLGLNIAAALVIFAMYIKYKQVEHIYEKHPTSDVLCNCCGLNKLTFFVGINAGLGMSLVGNFQETNCLIVHWVGAIMAFGGGALYECLQTIIYIRISPVIGQRRTTLFRIVLSVISVITWFAFTLTGFMAYGQYKGQDVTKWSEEDGGFGLHQISTQTEWVCAMSNMVYIILFMSEFKRMSLKPLEIVFQDCKNTKSPKPSDC